MSSCENLLKVNKYSNPLKAKRKARSVKYNQCPPVSGTWTETKKCFTDGFFWFGQMIMFRLRIKKIKIGRLKDFEKQAKTRQSRPNFFAIFVKMLINLWANYSESQNRFLCKIVIGGQQTKGRKRLQRVKSLRWHLLRRLMVVPWARWAGVASSVEQSLSPLFLYFAFGPWMKFTTLML